MGDGSHPCRVAADAVGADVKLGGTGFVSDDGRGGAAPGIVYRQDFHEAGLRELREGLPRAIPVEVRQIGSLDEVIVAIINDGGNRAAYREVKIAEVALIDIRSGHCRVEPAGRAGVNCPFGGINLTGAGNDNRFAGISAPDNGIAGGAAVRRVESERRGLSIPAGTHPDRDAVGAGGLGGICEVARRVKGLHRRPNSAVIRVISTG